MDAMIAISYHIIPIWNTKLNVEEPSKLFLGGGVGKERIIFIEMNLHNIKSTTLII